MADYETPPSTNPGSGHITAHLHELRDSDLHFTIDPVTRTIKNNNSLKTTLIQYDHNSEIFTFELPRYIEGHDMSLCNRIEIHYINIDSSTRKQNIGVYVIEDFSISGDNEDIMVCSWMISNNATQLVGSLSFAFRFACLTDTVIDYAWSTSPYSGISISNGIYNGEEVIEEYVDILEYWEQKLGVGVDDVVQEVVATEPNGVNIITLILSDGTRRSIEIRNGLTPSRGVDYWTEEDKLEIINGVLTVLQAAENNNF